MRRGVVVYMFFFFSELRDGGDGWEGEVGMQRETRTCSACEVREGMV